MKLYDPITNTLNGRIYGSVFITSEDPIVLSFTLSGSFNFNNPTSLPITKKMTITFFA